MAKITGSTEAAVFQINKWLGLNEDSDGDTRLKMGEASICENWKITLSGALQIRAGTRNVFEFGSPIRGMWSGRVGREEVFVCAANGHLWRLNIEEKTFSSLGSLINAQTTFFGFDEKLYMLNGSQYLCWDGTTLSSVAGYRPLVAVSCLASGGGTLLEQVNKLTGARRARFSPDGEATEFKLLEDDLASIDYVKSVATDEAMAYTGDVAKGTIKFESAPEQGVNTIEVGYTAKGNDRSKVCAMRFVEMFNGANDNRVFLYGDGGNTAIYSGLDTNGNATAEYFPDLNVLSVGEANTPITSMVRHFSRLVVFKSDSTYSVQYNTMTLEDGTLTAGFYISSVNKRIGCTPYGQASIITNNPRTLHSGGCYEWKATNTSGNLSADERTAKRISQRVDASLGELDLTSALCFDDESSQEYYIVCGDIALIHNYEQDTWYKYTNFPVTAMLRFGNELYVGTSLGEIRHVSREYYSDNGVPIDAYWRSGSMSFGRDWKRKYSSSIWVAMKPESNARVTLTALSNRSATFPKKLLVNDLATLSSVSFAHWSFNTNRRAQVERVKLKIKKFTYMHLIFMSNSDSSTATIAGADIQVRFSGDVK